MPDLAWRQAYIFSNAIAPTLAGGLDMPISVNEIAVDKCYVTATGRLRRVLEAENGKVTYEEARGKAAGGGNWGL
jgi:hypothetical protein